MNPMNPSDETSSARDQFSRSADASTGDAQTHSWGAGNLEPPIGPSTNFSPPRRHGHPERIARYRILGILGAGGMGIVYEAEQDNPRRIVALKVINPNHVSLDRIRRFPNESHILGRLQHPGIAQIYEAGTADSDHGQEAYFAMELIRGEPLIEYANRHRLGRRQRLDLVARVADAVGYAHLRGVIHRDLKPANILVGAEGQPKVLDFGVARVTDRDVRFTTLNTRVGEFIGTLAYMSPEQASGEPQELDERSDVYSLGVVTYELLAGRLPYDLPKSMLLALRVIREENPLRISTVERNLRGDVETMVGKALEKDKHLRYESAAALAADIRRYLNDEPIRAKGDSALYRLNKVVRRHRALSLVSALAVLLAIWWAINSTARSKRESRYAAEARASFHKARDVLQHVIRQVSTKLERVPGAGPVRQEIVSDAIAQFEGLLREEPDDPVLLNEYAEALRHLGDTVDILGEHAAAARLFEQALGIRRRLAAADPKNLGLRADLSINIVRLGNVLGELGNYTSALSYYREALGIDEELVRRRPGDLHFLDNLFWSYDRISTEARRAGNWDEAEILRQKQLALGEELVAAEPDHIEHLHGLLEALRGAHGRNAQEDPQRACADCLRATEIAIRLDELDKLDKLDPARPVTLNVLAC